MKKHTQAKKRAPNVGTAALPGLHPGALAFGKRIRDQFELDDAAEGLLSQALENLSIALRAQEVLREEGLVTRTKTGYLVAHPANKIAATASALFSRQLALMGLDLESNPIGRPVE